MQRVRARCSERQACCGHQWRSCAAQRSAALLACSNIECRTGLETNARVQDRGCVLSAQRRGRDVAHHCSRQFSSSCCSSAAGWCNCGRSSEGRCTSATRTRILSCFCRGSDRDRRAAPCACLQRLTCPLQGMLRCPAVLPLHACLNIDRAGMRDIFFVNDSTGLYLAGSVGCGTRRPHSPCPVAGASSSYLSASACTKARHKASSVDAGRRLVSCCGHSLGCAGLGPALNFPQPRPRSKWNSSVRSGTP